MRHAAASVGKRKNSSQRRPQPGQGATEYLLVLAVAILIALVVLGLLGGTFESNGDSQIRQSDIYWQAASPVSVSQHQDALNSTYLSAIIQNNINQGILILNFSVKAQNGIWGWNFGQDYIGPGETVWIPVTHRPAAGTNSTEVCSGRYYQFDVNISYTRADSPLPRTLVGRVPIVGTCGSAPYIQGSNGSGIGNATCPGSQQSCGQFCCPPGKPCCSGVCCPNGWICSNGQCCNPGNGC